MARTGKSKKGKSRKDSTKMTSKSKSRDQGMPE